jgi:DNA-binding XRE family transcriptional regulator
MQTIIDLLSLLYIIEKTGGSMNNLKKYREKAGMSVVKLAEKTGIDRNYVYKLEKEECDPTLRLAYRISDALKKSVLTIWPRGE